MTITEKIEALGFAKYLGYFEPGTPEWHKARRGIGGSDVSAVMDLNPWKSAYTLWAEKSGKAWQDLPAPTMPMKMGTAFEPVIRQLFAEANQDWLKIHETGTWASIEEPRSVANVDGIIEWEDGSLGILEIKFSRQYWDKLPEYYNLQVQHYLSVLGLKRAIVVAVAGGDWKEFEVIRDDSLIDTMKGRVEAFYGFLDTDTAPAYDGSESTYETVRELSEGLEEGEIELGSLWANLLQAKSESEHWEKQFKAHKSAVLAFMNGTKYGLFQGDKVIALQARNGKPFITFK
ncbi:COG5377 Phage-related protein, predicted endonuclease [uncultured Caudovirales phage]|uniref:COG5377 Phage-related protein, predicted endonuclease n=1 Tax=uncultured Caudovirales phage TaxID=2100421 RepID=A0A6J5M8I2_9CAUD|nr:COG5377 Phage-related protein, predicted endonuclease [uncultured Caudovirales phage]